MQKIKYHQQITLTIGAVLIVIATFFVLARSENHTTVSSAQVEAISIVQSKYPELKGYPYDSLPAKTITAEFNNGWYLAFIQNGSGRSIISARCYLVKSDGDVEEVGVYNPTSNTEPEPLTISPRTCK